MDSPPEDPRTLGAGADAGMDTMLPDAFSNETDLLTRAAAGELGAVRALLDRTGSTVYGFVFARVGGDATVADDLVQETFIESMRSAHTFRGDAALTTWMCAIARRRIARHWESERKAEIARSGLTVVGGSVEPDPVERRDEIVRALGSLSAIHRQVLVLKYLDDRTVEQIAADLQRTVVQIQSLLQRARANLRRALEAES